MTMPTVETHSTTCPVFTNGVLQRFIDEHHPLLDTLPGDVFRGNLTGHGEEWRTELVIDSVPASDSESSDEVMLVFSLIELETENVKATLTLENHVAEVGVEDKHTFTFGSAEDLPEQLSAVCKKWELDEEAAQNGMPFLAEVRNVMAQMYVLL